MATDEKDRRAPGERGRARWPGVVISDARFAAHLTELGVDGEAALHVEDLYLACACADGVPPALAAFERECLSRVAEYVSRVAGAARHLDEIQQRVRTRLLLREPGQSPRIARYSGRGALRPWVRVTAVRVALDLLREKSEPVGGVADVAGRAAVEADAENAHLRARYQGELERAVSEALGELTAQQRALLRQHHIEGLSLDALAAQNGVHRSTAARWLKDARVAVLGGARRRLKAHFNASDLTSVFRALRSGLHVSVARLLG
jgi:RNA polymerase sigma-70 factor (ECF subfamily)